MPYTNPQDNRDFGKRYYAKYRDRILKRSKNDKLKFHYGITEQDFEEMKVAQDNKCLGCGLESKLCVDHCHETGKVRGLLCRKCNASIGLAQEDVQILKNLVSYLEGTGS